METLGKILKRSVRTIQRPVHLLSSLGLIEVLERRRHKGRYNSYLYRNLKAAPDGDGLYFCSQGCLNAHAEERGMETVTP